MGLGLILEVIIEGFLEDLGDGMSLQFILFASHGTSIYPFPTYNTPLIYSN